jgi:hypothetical protein
MDDPDIHTPSDKFDSNEDESFTPKDSTESHIELTDALFNKYLEKVFEIRPNIKAIYDETQEVDLFTYNKRHVRENRNPVIRTRKGELIEVVENHVKKRLGSKIAESVGKQLKGNDSVSTTQHSAPLGDYVLNYTIQNALPYFNTDHPNLQNVIILACGMVSFNNSSTPRGLIVHGTKESKPISFTLPLFGRADDAKPVIFNPAYTHTSVDEILKELQKLQGENTLTKEQAGNIRRVLEEIFTSPHVLSAQSFTDQLTISNYYIFKKLFSKYDKKVPNLIYLAQEEIVLELLVANHLSQDTAINKILFDGRMHELLEKYFEGVSGGFSKGERKGTFLFWANPKNSKYRLQLWREEKSLVSEDGSYRLEMSPEALKQAIARQEIVPSVMLTFMVLSFYYGLILTGGFRQTYDLQVLLEKYREMLTEYGDQESIQATEGLITSNLVLPSSILYQKYPSGEFVPASSLDILINSENQGSWEEWFNALRQIPFARSMIKTFPVIYNRFTPADKKDPTLAAITEADIDKYLEFTKKVPPIVGL